MLIFETRIAVRYLVSSRLQSALLVFGVCVGVVVFTFMAALMNGLGARLTDDVTGNVAHVTLEPELRTPRTFMPASLGRALYAVQPGHEVKSVIRTYRAAVALAARLHGVRVVVPEVLGNATLTRGQKVVAVAVTGVEPKQAADIARLQQALVRGRLELGVGDMVIGSRLARELAVDVGDRMILQAARGSSGAPDKGQAVVTVRGIFSLGVQAIDERMTYVELGAAKKLFALDGGVSIIELKLDDVWQAPVLAERLARATHLKASSWLDRNARLQEGLRAQASSAALIKAFSLLTIAIGVASALFLSVSRRRSEIGILRSFGIGRGAIVRTFVLQGLLIGTVGGLVGVVLGFAFAHLLLVVSMKANGTPALPIDPNQGEYLRACALASVASALAALWPAWAASKTDPLEAIQS
ncbi:MAG: hypothetical protein RL701_7131 [Pseudomonadota bacterium]